MKILIMSSEDMTRKQKQHFTSTLSYHDSNPPLTKRQLHHHSPVPLSCSLLVLLILK
jgi:hypothetical protein